MYHEAEVGVGLQPAGHRAGGRCGLSLQYPAGGHAGQGERVSVLLAAQRARPVTVEIERPQTHRADPQREPEQRPHARPQHRRGEGNPPAGHRICQVRLGHDPVLLVGINTRALAQRVLQFLDQPAYLVARPHRPARYIT